MTTETLDPLIHVPTRLKIVATLAALPDGDALSLTRLQDMTGPTPGNARLDATIAATTYGEISRATWDLPDVTALSRTSVRRQKARRRRRPRPVASQETLPRRRRSRGGRQS